MTVVVVIDAAPLVNTAVAGDDIHAVRIFGVAQGFDFPAIFVVVCPFAICGEEGVVSGKIKSFLLSLIMSF